MKTRTLKPMGLGITLAATLCLFSISAWATTLLKLDLDALTAQSEQIVEGKVTSIKSFKKGNRIFTNVTLQVKTRLKGSGKSTVTFTQLGGRHGDLVTYVPGQAGFMTGEHVLVFLERPGQNAKNPLVVTGMAQGKFKVVLGPDKKTPFAVPQLGKTNLMEKKIITGEASITKKLQHTSPSVIHTQPHALDIFKAQILLSMQSKPVSK